MKLSIITINYNNLEGLKRTYESVVSQTCQDFEWIIIDGGSTDGSKDFIEEHQAQFAYWCSEPDKGIYNAMNKGIVKATGEYLQFLNSGDNLVDDKVIEEFLALGWEEDVVSGDIILDGDINEIRYNPDEEELDFDRMRSGAGVTHPSSYIKKKYLINMVCMMKAFA
jgi:glycosyltransferase involved in cell wall biosynthesis